jgi:hypothetical protein
MIGLEANLDSLTWRNAESSGEANDEVEGPPRLQLPNLNLGARDFDSRLGEAQ